MQVYACRPSCSFHDTAAVVSYWCWQSHDGRFVGFTITMNSEAIFVAESNGRKRVSSIVTGLLHALRQHAVATALWRMIQKRQTPSRVEGQRRVRSCSVGSSSIRSFNGNWKDVIAGGCYLTIVRHLRQSCSIVTQRFSAVLLCVLGKDFLTTHRSSI